MCFEAGNILLIKDFQFEDGGEPKDKFLIVITVNPDKMTFVRSLTSSQQKIPDNKVKHGCCNSSDGIFSHYVFEKGRIICDNNFAFRKNTFIYYNNNVLQLSIPEFHVKQYNISIAGTLTTHEYQRLIKCMKSSGHIKRGVKRIIEAITL
jgi:hypothetical protein